MLGKARGALGWGDGYLRGVTLFNSIAELTETEAGVPCLQLEADARHVEIVLSQLKLGVDKGSKAVTSLGAKRTAEE
eukprot:4152011-Pyramimonas_sp.AAC.1